MSVPRKTPLPFPHSGECIKYYRKLRGYSQEQLAEMVGMDPSYFGYIERGRQMASIAYLRKLALALVVPIEALLLPEYHSSNSSIQEVLIDMFHQMDKDECIIAYEILTRIVPMIRKKQLQ